MKTCRFCMHEQESGEYCEACGSPFSADKLDFSGESMPDPTAGAFPDPTKSAFPDPTESVFPDTAGSAFPETAESPAAPATSNETVPDVMPVAAAGMPSMDAPKPETVPSKETDSKESSPKKEKKKASRETSEKKQPEEKKAFSEESKKIMYSASLNHETVYLKGKGNLLKKGPVNPQEFSPYLTDKEDAPAQQQGAGWWNGAAPSASSTPQSAPSTIPTPPQAKAPYSASGNGGKAEVPTWLYVFAIVMIVLSGLGMVCLCGAGLIPLVMALIAISKITSVKNGSSEDIDHDLSSAKILLVISVVILVLCSILMITTVLL